MRAPTNPVLVNYVGTGVLDRPLTQQNLRMVREAHPYAHRVRLCEINAPDKPEFVGALDKSYPINKEAIAAQLICNGIYYLFYLI